MKRIQRIQGDLKIREILIYFEEINFGGYEKIFTESFGKPHSNDLKGTEALKGTHIFNQVK